MGRFSLLEEKKHLRNSKSFAAISTLLQVGLICIQRCGSDSILIVRLSYSPRLQDHDSLLTVVQQRHQIIRWLNTRARCLFSYIEEALEEDVWVCKHVEQWLIKAIQQKTAAGCSEIYLTETVGLEGMIFAHIPITVSEFDLCNWPIPSPSLFSAPGEYWSWGALLRATSVLGFELATLWSQPHSYPLSHELSWCDAKP